MVALQNQFRNNGGPRYRRKKQSAANQAGSNEDISIDFSEEMEEDRSFWENQRFFIILFEEGVVRDNILNQQNWFVNKHALYLQPWTPNFNPIPLVHYFAPIWIKLYNLPIKYWGDGFLEKVGRTIGTLLEVDVDDEANLRKYAKLRVATVRCIPKIITLLTVNGEWRQQLEIEKEIHQCQRCGSRMHGEMDCQMFVRKATKDFRKPSQKWKRKSISLEKMITESLQPLAAKSGSKEKIAKSTSKSDGKPAEAKGDEASFNAVKEKDDLEKTLDNLDHIEHHKIEMVDNGGEGSASKGPAPTCIFSTMGKGISDTKFEYDKGSDEDFLQEDELDNVNP
ncbi:hypothetical protein SUGI_1098710 [Cryptomeria japonica]|nr:hypothetical protein SUGI_1098710 [Cryptomeria japonica]